MKRFACLSFVLIAACGDDGGTPIDAASIDAAVDAAVDAPIDAAPTVYSGTLTALEVAVLNPGASGTFFGRGVQLGISFGDSVTGVAATMEEQPGSPLGCKLFNFNRAQAIQASVGNDEGPVQVAVTGGQNPPTYPACSFTANVGYTCPHTGTLSTGGTIAAGPQAGLATLTDADTTFNAGNTTNRYVNISGATTAANNGTFPIVGVSPPNTIVYANPAFVAEAIPATGAHINLAGVGPTPGAPAVGFLDNASALTMALTPGGGNHFQAFTATTGAGTVGDDFTLEIAELNKLTALPSAAGALTLSCTAANCPAGSASGTLINIVTTDASVANLSPFAMPLPTTKRVQIRCASLGATSVTIPAAYMAALGTSGATRIQTTFMRPTLMSGGPATVNALSGHAIIGFTNR